MNTEQKPSTKLILEIANSFPALQGQLFDYNPQTFDPAYIALQFPHWSTYERELGKFLINVWDPNWAERHKHTFDVVKVAPRLDLGNQEALAAWILHPRLP